MKSAINTVSLWCFLLLVKQGAQSQSLFNLEPDYFHFTATPAIFENEFGEFTALSKFESTVDDTLYLKWQRIIPPDCPNEWDIYIADTQMSWLGSISTNIDSATMLNVPMPLRPSVGLNDFSLFFKPHSVTGCCTVEVRFSMADAPDSILQIAYYEFAMMDSSCFVSAQNEVAVKDQVLVSPNPASESFQVTAPKPINYIRLFDVMGSQVSITTDSNQPRITVIDLPNGTYFLQIELVGGQYIYQKLMVQH